MTRAGLLRAATRAAVLAALVLSAAAAVVAAGYRRDPAGLGFVLLLAVFVPVP